MRVEYSGPAEEDLEELDTDERLKVKKEVEGMAQQALPDPESYDVEMVVWNNELRYRLKLVDSGLDHRVLFRFREGGSYIEVLGVFPDRDELEYR
ncbi:MAG: type II toxin-antitoxin system RelE/ParE family toxin [Candidatus Nanohaloarchaea archaeon]